MAVPVWWEELRHFDPFETFETPDGVEKLSFPDPEKMDRQMMFALDEAREQAGIPFVITSSYRAGDDKAHGKGLAVDVRAHGNIQREVIYEALKAVGFFRRGVYDKHIHGDMDNSLPRGIWGGESS